MSASDPAASTGRRAILGHFRDAANLLTLAGLLSSTAAIALALNAEYAAAGIGLVLAFGFDALSRETILMCSRCCVQGGLRCYPLINS